MTRLLYFLRETVISLRRNLLMTLAGILTVAVSLFLFGGVMLISRLVENGTDRWRGDVEIEIFMKVDATNGQIAAVETELKDSPEVKDFEFLTKQDAFEEFKRLFQDDPALVREVTPESLPTSFRVAPKEAELTETLAKRFEARAGVDNVLTAKKQVDRMLTATRWLRLTFWALAGVLLASSLFLIMNTIRLATFARRREIEVMKLVGASNWFVRIPFMAEGLVQGAIGAGFAFGLVYGLRVILTDLVKDADNLFNHFYVTAGDAIGIGMIVLAIGAGIGVLGSAIGLRRFLEG